MRALLACLILFAFAAPAFGTARGADWPEDRLTALAAAADAAPGEGLPRSQARLSALAEARASGSASQIDAAADALLRELACTRARGWADPARLDPQWKIPRPAAPDFAAIRAEALNGAGVEAALQALRPQDPRYDALMAELARLTAAPGADPAQIGKVRASLERWRQLPRAVPADRIEVNVPEFALTLYREGAAAHRHDVIVGEAGRQTPALLDTVTALKLNPDWTAPRSIAQRSLVRELRRDPAAVAARGYEAIAPNGRSIAVTQVNWRTTARNGAPYWLRQKPGPNNALGQVKLEMPNAEAIYLHGTPAQDLFDEASRAFSAGCVRVKEATELAVALLDRAPGWDEARLRATIAGDRVTRAPLATPLPVWLVYFTAAPDATGAIQYFDDVYGRDAALLAALDGPAACGGAPAAGRSGRAT